MQFLLTLSLQKYCLETKQSVNHKQSKKRTSR